MEEPDSTTESPTSVSSLPLPRGKDYHAFFCFNSANQKWVDETIAYLESPEIGFKCVDHRRDFHPGKTTVRNIEEFIENSWKYVLVMTPDFVASEWCSFETDIMVNMSLEQREECIIPILLQPCTIPKSLQLLTYIDISQSDKWRERLVKAVKRTDISSQRLQVSKRNMQEKKQRAKKNISVYQQCVDNYKRDKRQLELERKSLENDVHNTFSVLSKRILDELERQKTKRLDNINEYMDKRLVALVRKLDMAKTILESVEKSLDDNALKTFTSHLDEYEELERRQRGTSYTEFVTSNILVDRLAQLMSEFDVGFLREIDITQIRSKEDRDNFLKEAAPSWAILPSGGELTPWNLVKCPYFQLDPMTVRADCSILPDGSLYNKPPSQPHPPSDRRLRKYRGAVGTTRLTSRSIYYWHNHVDVNLEKELESRNLVFEVGLSTRGVFDETHSTTCTTGTLCLYVDRCTQHTTDSVCMKVSKNNVTIHHQTFYPNKTGQWPSLVLGFLLDTIRHRWTVYDVTKKEEITAVEDISDVEEFTPMFGVYAHIQSKTKMSLITGKELNISDDMYNLIERALE